MEDQTAFTKGKGPKTQSIISVKKVLLASLT